MIRMNCLKGKLRIFFVFLLFFACRGNDAGRSVAGERHDQAKSILERARREAKRLSYHYYSDSDARVYHQGNPDGTEYYKYEVNGKPTRIMNKEGNFKIKEDIAIKENFGTAFINCDQFAVYDLREGIYEQIPCFIVKETIPNSPEVFAYFKQRHEEMNGKGSTHDEIRREFEDVLVSVNIYYIGRNDFFIHSSEGYFLTGKLAFRSDKTQVEFVPAFPEGTFDLPKGLQIKIANTFEESTALWIQAAEKAFKEKRRLPPPKRLGLGERASIFFKRTADSAITAVLEYGSYFFCLSGAVSVGLLIYIKKSGKLTRGPGTKKSQ